MAYSDKVLDHYTNPRNVGSMDKNSAEVGTGLVGAPECGDVMKLQIKVNPADQHHRRRQVQDLRLRLGHRFVFAGHRVGEGQDRRRSATIKNTDIVKELSLPPVKIHCSVLAEDAIRAAIGDWKKKKARNRPDSRSRLRSRHKLGRGQARSRYRLRADRNHEHDQH